MKRTVLAAGLACAVFTYGAVARAQSASASETAVFSAVDGFDHTEFGSLVEVTGVVRGDGTARAFRLMTSYAEAEHVAGCERMALLAMSRPGYYLLSINQSVGRAADGTATWRYLISCGLSRAVP